MPFKNTEVAARFEMTGEDQDIIYRSFSGKLSEAPLAIVEGMVSRKSNLVKLKAPAGSGSSTKANPEK